MGMGWLVGLLQVGPVCGHVQLLVGFVAIEWCLGMFECPFWFGAVGGRQQLLICRNRFWG